ncbi:MAG: hydrogenase maturation protease [Flavobacteriaceae bacterium]|nr:hydrogenase maturation protease [Flavobacteriaceae bacterium]
MKNSENPITQLPNTTYFFEEDKSKSVLVMGVGNYLMGDEGVGVQLIQAMEKMKLPAYIDLVDGGTGGFLLLNMFETYPKIILVDATMDGKEAGTISLIKPRFAADYPSALSVHDVGLRDMIEAIYLMEKIPEIHLFTITIDEMKPMTLDLSKPVKNAITLCISQILALAAQMHPSK